MVKLTERNDTTEGNTPKKIKFEETEEIKQEIILKPSETKVERCLICKQYSNEVLLYNGHPNNSVDEYVALTDEKLMLFTGDESEVNQQDERPTHKVFYLFQKTIFCRLENYNM